MEVGEELVRAGKNVVVCDLWGAMMARAGWKGSEVLAGSLKAEKNEAFKEMMYDGMYNLCGEIVSKDSNIVG